MAKSVAFIGLGVMGFPMAGHLARAGHDVCVYNRSPEKAELWLKRHNGRRAPTPGEAASDAEFVFLCVGNDNDVREVVAGRHGVLSGISTGAVIVDHTTTSAELARDLEAMSLTSGVGFLDAPVSGGQAGAENGVLTIMTGGEKQSFDRASPVMSAYGRTVKLMGPAGAGQLTKMVNQICIAGIVQGLAEGLHFAKRAGLDGADVVEVISKGAAQSWQMENRYKTMLEGRFDFGFAVDWMRKDLDIVLQEAEKNGARLELTELVDRYYAEIQSMGGARWDTSSLIARLEPVRSAE